MDELSIVISDLDAKRNTIIGAILDNFYQYSDHPHCTLDIILVPMHDDKFFWKYRLPYNLLSKKLKHQIGSSDVSRFQLHHETVFLSEDSAGYFGELLIITIAKDKTAVVLLQFDPKNIFTARKFDIVRQVVLMILSRHNQNFQAFCKRKRLNKWLEFATDTWGEHSDIALHLKHLAIAKMGRTKEYATKSEFYRDLNKALAALRKKRTIALNQDIVARELTISKSTLERCLKEWCDWRNIKRRYKNGEEI